MIQYLFSLAVCLYVLVSVDCSYYAAVTEVVWEGEETETKADSHAVRKTDNSSANNNVNRYF